jgi:hypothetical protein
MHGHVRSEEGKAVGQAEDSVAQAAVKPQTGKAKSGLVDELQGQAWFNALGTTVGPTTEEVPDPQAEHLGDEQPKACEVAGDLVRQELPHAGLDAAWITGHGLAPGLAGLCFDGRLRMWAVTIEFFFEARIPRRRVRRCGH